MCLVCPYQSLYVCKPPASWWYAPIVTSAGLRTTNALVTQDLTRSKGRVSELQVANADLAKRLAESQAVARQLQDSLHLSRSQGDKQAEVGLCGAVSALLSFIPCCRYLLVDTKQLTAEALFFITNTECIALCSLPKFADLHYKQRMHCADFRCVDSESSGRCCGCCLLRRASTLPC